MEPKSASAGLTRRIVLAGAFTGAAVVLLLRDGQPDGGLAQAPSLEVRGVSLGPPLREALDEFGAEPRDPSWASGMEARLQSELSQPTLMLAES